MVYCLQCVISGGQTGVDQTALIVAKELGYVTGGIAPKGFRTDAGAAPWLAELGLKESAHSDYKPRTIANVRAADLTVWFGDCTSPGGRLTKRIALAESRWVENPSGYDLRLVLEGHGIKTLNVAGNRERINPAASHAAEAALRVALRRS